jgi:hypothetical protein
MATFQSGRGRIELFDDFCGPEIPVANAVAYGTSAGGCNYYLGPFRVTGDLGETDTGVVGLAKASGYVRISGNNEDGKGVAIGTEAVFSPVLNGTLVLETRIEMAALTTRSIFVGFGALNADDVAEPITSATVTHTFVDTVVAGFVLDSQLTAATAWHMPYKGGSATASTVSTAVNSGVIAVAAESDVLRIEIDPDGRARWYINGVKEQEVAGAVSTTTLLAGFVGAFGTTTTAADADIDYLLITANRDWTR